jgi:hypothetical protein
MKPTDNVEKLIRDLHVLDINTSIEMDRRILHDTLKVQKECKRTKLAGTQPDIWRKIMKSSITKLAVTAIIVVIGLGILAIIDTGSKSGVAWAEVAKNVEASRGVIFRARETGSRDPNDDWPNGYRIFWRSAVVSRMDVYRSGQIYRTIYLDYDGKTTIGVLHDAKKYSKEAMSDQTAHADKGWSDPQGLLNLGLSLEHHTLGQKTINDVLCEGIEATGPDGSTGRVWVGVETGYPVLVEIQGVDGSTGTMDQFRWNVDLSAESVEPEIPADYESLGLEGEMKILSEQGKKELLKVEEILRDGAIAWKVHVYKYELSDGQTKEMREGGDGMPVYSQDQFKEFKPKLEEFRQFKKAGSGEDLGTYKQTVEGRVFSFKREKYILSDGTEMIYSVGTPRDEQ